MKVTVLAGGCFNTIHKGHIYFLNTAKSLGDELVVVITHDINNKKPYAISAQERKSAVVALNIADKVIIGDPYNKEEIVLRLSPDIIALGYDQAKPKIEWLGKYERIDKHGEYSSESILSGK